MSSTTLNALPPMHYFPGPVSVVVTTTEKASYFKQSYKNPSFFESISSLASDAMESLQDACSFIFKKRTRLDLLAENNALGVVARKAQFVKDTVIFFAGKVIKDMNVKELVTSKGFGVGVGASLGHATINYFGIGYAGVIAFPFFAYSTWGLPTFNLSQKQVALCASAYGGISTVTKVAMTSIGVPAAITIPLHALDAYVFIHRRLFMPPFRDIDFLVASQACSLSTCIFPEAPGILPEMILWGCYSYLINKICRLVEDDPRFSEELEKSKAESVDRMQKEVIQDQLSRIISTGNQPVLTGSKNHGPLCLVLDYLQEG